MSEKNKGIINYFKLKKQQQNKKDDTYFIFSFLSTPAPQIDFKDKKYKKVDGVVLFDSDEGKVCFSIEDVFEHVFLGAMKCDDCWYGVFFNLRANSEKLTDNLKFLNFSSDGVRRINFFSNHYKIAYNNLGVWFNSENINLYSIGSKTYAHPVFMTTQGNIKKNMDVICQILQKYNNVNNKDETELLKFIESSAKNAILRELLLDDAYLIYRERKFFKSLFKEQYSVFESNFEYWTYLMYESYYEEPQESEIFFDPIGKSGRAELKKGYKQLTKKYAFLKVNIDSMSVDEAVDFYMARKQHFKNQVDKQKSPKLP